LRYLKNAISQQFKKIFNRPFVCQYYINKLGYIVDCSFAVQDAFEKVDSLQAHAKELALGKSQPQPALASKTNPKPIQSQTQTKTKPNPKPTQTKPQPQTPTKPQTEPKTKPNQSSENDMDDSDSDSSSDSDGSEDFEEKAEIVTKVATQKRKRRTPAEMEEAKAAQEFAKKAKVEKAEQIKETKAAKADEKISVRKVKLPKDPNAPKKPATGYLQFCSDQRPALVADKMDTKLIMAALGKQWTELDVKKKAKYNEVAKTAMVEYTAVKAKYEATKEKDGKEATKTSTKTSAKTSAKTPAPKSPAKTAKTQKNSAKTSAKTKEATNETKEATKTPAKTKEATKTPAKTSAAPKTPTKTPKAGKTPKTPNSESKVKYGTLTTLCGENQKLKNPSLFFNALRRGYNDAHDEDKSLAWVKSRLTKPKLQDAVNKLSKEVVKAIQN